MIIKRIKSLVAFVAISLVAGSQLFAQDIKVKGVIVDSLSRNPEAAIVVQFYKAEDNSKAIAYTTTDANGNFAHSLSEKGSYRLFLHNLGKKDKSIQFTIDDQTAIDLGTILLQDDTETLMAGTITALSELVAIEADRITYKLANDAESKTKSILDILRKVPLVSVDVMGRISVNGNSSFAVYMDGIKNQVMSDNPTDVFRSMPASMVESIEVITDPGARYDAEGVGAVLNITSTAKEMRNKGKNFHNGNVSLGGSTRRVHGGIYYSAIKDKLTVSMNLSGIRIFKEHCSLYGERLSNSDSGQLKSISSGVSDLVSNNIFGNISASYEIDKYNFLSFSAGSTDIINKDKEFLNSRLEFSSHNYEYNEDSYTKMRLGMYNANIDYQHLWKDQSGKYLVVSYQVSGRPNTDIVESKYTPVTALPGSLEDRINNGFSNSLTHTVQSDFQLPVSDNHSFSTGAKMMMRHNQSNHIISILRGDSYVTEDSENVDYDFYNNIGALYAEYNGTVKSFRLRAGARYEHTWQKAQDNKNNDKDFSLNYGNLVPSGSIQYNINDTNNIGLTYTMTIRRPGISYLNPYVDLSDPSAMTYGNPDLKAEKGHQIGLSYNYFSRKWMLTTRLRQNLMNNGISRYMFYDENNILNTTYGNIINGSITALNTYVSWSPTHKTTLSLNGQIGYNVYESPKLGLKAEGWTYDMMFMAEHILPKGTVLSGNIAYMPNSMSLQSRTCGIWDAGISVSRSFLDDKLHISLDGKTHLTKGRGVLMVTQYHGTDFSSRNEILMPWSDVFISVRYSFGNNDNIQVKRSRKTRSSNDQIDLDKTERTF